MARTPMSRTDLSSTATYTRAICVSGRFPLPKTNRQTHRSRLATLVSISLFLTTDSREPRTCLWILPSQLHPTLNET
jgi:hypothetical protein